MSRWRARPDSTPWRYALAILVIAAMTGIAWAIRPWAAQSAVGLLYGGVLLAVVMAGPRPGVLAVLLSALVADFLFWEPAYRMLSTPAEFVAAAVYLAVGGLLIGVTQRRQQTERELYTQIPGALSEAVPQIGWVEDEQGNVVHVNQRWREYTGLTKSASLGQGAWQALPPQDQAELPRQWRDAAKLGDEAGILVRLRRADGHYRWHRCNALPIAAPDGSTLGWLGTAIDIHTTRLAELNRTFLEELSTRIARIQDPKERSWIIVEELGRYLNVDRSTLSDVTFNDRRLVTEFDVWRGERRVYAEPKVRGYRDLPNHDAYVAGRTVVVEDTATDPVTQQFHNGIGQDRLRSFIGVPCLREGQWSALLGVACTAPRAWTEDDVLLVEMVAERFWPLIEQARAESAMRDSEARFRAIFEQAAIGVAQVGLDGVIIRANPNLCALVGYAEKGLHRRALADITLAEDFETQRQQMDRLVSGEITYFTQEKRYLHRNGELVWGMLSMSLVRDQTTQRPLYFISATVDIGPRKQAEQRLSFLADASKELAAGLDYRTTLQRVADTMVPHMADWCAVTTVGADNTLEQVAVAHVDPAKVQWARELSRRNPTDLASDIGVARVIRTGEAAFYPEIPDELLVAAARDEEELRLTRQIGLNSVMIVPLQARDRVVGALTLIWSDSGHHYTAADLVFAQELGHRAAVAIDNAHLFDTVRRAEQQQAELLAELEALFANAPIGIAFFNQHVEFVRVNESLAQWGGVPVATMLNRSVREVLADLAPQIEPRIRQVFAGGEGIFGVELCGHVPSDPDRQFYWYASWYPIISEGGKPRHVGMMLVDITAQKENEQALRESEERYRATFDKAAVGVAHTHIDGRWLQVNDRLCEILGYSRAELLQISFQGVTHPDDLSTDLDGVRRLVAGEIDGYRMEKRYFRKDGTIVWVNLSVSLVRQPPDGNPAYFIAVIEDVSEQKRAQTRLQLLAETGIALSQYAGDNESLQTMAELLVPRLADWCAINIAQPTGQIELVANAFIDPAKQAQIRELADHYPLDMAAKQGIPSVIRNGKPLLYRAIPSELTASNVRLQQLHALGLSSLIIVPLQARGRVLGAMTLARSDPELGYTEDDLSFAQELAQSVALTVDSGHLYAATREAEARLRQLNESLEERVAARTAELERSNRELDQFAYVASHDLKAPLRAIANLAAWIESDSGAVMLAASREHLAKLRGRAVRMERLLDDMLTYARVGRNEAAYRYVDTRELVHELTDLIAPATFKVSIEGDMPVVYTQRAPLETILRNLIDNAVKHHDKPAGHIRISAREQAKFVEFSVADDGPGIPPQYHDRIFEMFQTLQPRDQMEGSGIGLAIVKKIVENQGGKIVVESEEGKGARFTISWPIIRSDDAQ